MVGSYYYDSSEEQNFDLAKLIFIRVRYVHADPINFIYRFRRSISNTQTTKCEGFFLSH